MASSVREKMMQVEKERKIAQRVEETKSDIVRARDDKGHFIADDPSTPENEAWVEEKVEKVRKLIKAARQEPVPAAPAKKKKAPAKKPKKV